MNKEITILIVEDEIFSSKYLVSILNSLNFTNIHEVTNANDALKVVRDVKIDLVFMDINIKGSIDGIECSRILNNQYFLPIIFSSAYGDSVTIKEASKSNVFGYVIKPFESQDIEAVLNVALKFIQNYCEINVHKEENTLILGDNIVYKYENKTLYVDNNPISLTKKEINLLYYFCKNKNQNISYDILKVDVWENSEISNSTIRDTIARLKKKVPNLDLINVINFGYILKVG